MSTYDKADYQAAARKLRHREGELEVDPNAEVSIPGEDEHGAYVQAWIWISDDDVHNMKRRNAAEGR